MIENILYTLRSESRLGWLISSVEQSVLVFAPQQEVQVLHGDDRLPVLGDIPLVLMVNDLFSWLRFPA